MRCRDAGACRAWLAWGGEAGPVEQTGGRSGVNQRGELEALGGREGVDDGRGHVESDGLALVDRAVIAHGVDQGRSGLGTTRASAIGVALHGGGRDGAAGILADWRSAVRAGGESHGSAAAVWLACH